MYDLLIKCGRVIDPARHFDAVSDIAIDGHEIVAVRKDIPSEHGRRVIDGRGKLVTPGLIDLHCHVDNRTAIGIHPDSAGVRQGVTTVIDAGTTGHATFGGFRQHVLPAARTTVFCFLALCPQGVRRTPDLRTWRDVDIEAIAATIEANRDVIKGIKLRLIGRFVAEAGVKIVAVAKETAGQFHLPIMVHLGDYWHQVPPTLVLDLLKILERDDILSHAFSARWGSAISADGDVPPEMVDAMHRGVVLDVGHGKANFSYTIARKAIAQGILPTTASSDVGAEKLRSPVFGLTVTMSKLLALGLDLEQVIGMATINPARALRIEDRAGTLAPGRSADVSILELLPGPWKLLDSERQALEAADLIVPRITVKSGQVVSARLFHQPERLR